MELFMINDIYFVHVNEEAPLAKENITQLPYKRRWKSLYHYRLFYLRKRKKHL